MEIVSYCAPREYKHKLIRIVCMKLHNEEIFNRDNLFRVIRLYNSVFRFTRPQKRGRVGFVNIDLCTIAKPPLETNTMKSDLSDDLEETRRQCSVPYLNRRHPGNKTLMKRKNQNAMKESMKIYFSNMKIPQEYVLVCKNYIMNKP